MALEEPTLAEEIRSLSDAVRRLTDQQALYVTREILELKLEGQARDLREVANDQKEDRVRLDTMSRLVWSAVIGPVIVGIVLYLVLGKTP